jgi:hypothetical protein
MSEKILQRYDGCFTFGHVVKVWLIAGAFLVFGALCAQPVCVQPNRIPAIREAMQAPAESGVDRSGPWELSRPVALKYGLKLTGPVDERLDSGCAQYASQQQWKQWFSASSRSINRCDYSKNSLHSAEVFRYALFL